MSSCHRQLFQARDWTAANRRWRQKGLAQPTPAPQQHGRNHHTIIICRRLHIIPRHPAVAVIACTLRGRKRRRRSLQRRRRRKSRQRRYLRYRLHRRHCHQCRMSSPRLPRLARCYGSFTREWRLALQLKPREGRSMGSFCRLPQRAQLVTVDRLPPQLRTRAMPPRLLIASTTWPWKSRKCSMCLLKRLQQTSLLQQRRQRRRRHLQ